MKNDAYLLESMQLAWPTDWADVFERPAPLLMEIGFGGADFLIDLARQRPLANILGIEISLFSIRKAGRKAKIAGLDNLRVLQADAKYILRALCQEAVLDEVYINFPDPWPKDRHHHRRLISDSFLHLLATRMKPSGRLEIATDHADYALWITEHLERTPYFTSRTATTFVTEDNERLRTKYELTGLQEGRVCHYYHWQRNDTPAPNTFPHPKEYDMPHVILQSPLNLTEIAEKFEPQTIAVPLPTAVAPETPNDDTIRINFNDAYQSVRDQKILVETYINENLVRQRVGLTIRRRAEGDILINLHEVGFPRPTEGVKQAIALLAQWVMDLHPDTKIIKNTVGLTT